MPRLMENNKTIQNIIRKNTGMLWMRTQLIMWFCPFPFFGYPCQEPGLPAKAAEASKGLTPTPCRQQGQQGLDLAGVLGLIPDLQDVSVDKPKAGTMRISQAAIEGRLTRIFKPNCKGEYKVSSEILGQWRSKKGKKSLSKIFQSCGFNTDWFGEK